MGEWASLPEDIQEQILRLGQPDNDAFIRKAIPALGGKSILELHDAEGDNQIRQYLTNAIGKF